MCPYGTRVYTGIGVGVECGCHFVFVCAHVLCVQSKGQGVSMV